MASLIFDKDSKKFLYQDTSGAMVPAPISVNRQTGERLAYDGTAWVPLPGPSRTAGQHGEDFARSVGQGLTFGFGDEALAGARAAFGQGDYATNLAEEQRRNAEIPAATRFAGEALGSIAMPMAVPAKVAGAAARIPGMVRNPAIGAATGALFGAGEAQPGQRSEGAVAGGLMGAAGATVLSPLLTGAQSLFMPQRRAAFDLGRAFANDKLTPESAIAALADLRKVRPDATLADIGDQNVRGLVERVAQTPGGGRTDIFERMEQRQRGQLARISADLRGLTGTTKSAIDATTDTMAARQTAANPLYEQAFSLDVAQSPEVVQAWQRATAQGYGKAFLGADDFKKMLQTEHGTTETAAVPLMKQIDTWKRVADDFIRDNVGTNRARVVKDMKNRVLDAVDAANPQYAQARGVWENESKYLDALESGRSILQRDLDPQQFARDYARMTDYEKEAHRIGAVSFITGRMGGDPAKLADMTKYLRSPNVRQNLAVLMPDDAARTSWAQRFAHEEKSSELVGQTLRGSPTARRLAEMKQADDMLPDLVIDLISGAPAASILRRAVGAAQKATGGTVRMRSDKALADVLTAPRSIEELTAAMQRADKAGPAMGRLPAQAAGFTEAVAPLLGYER